MTNAPIDWQGLEETATAQVVAAVREARFAFPDEHIYGAMFHEFYGDGTVMYWPLLTVGTEEALKLILDKALTGWAEDRGEDAADLEHSLRWSGPDLNAVRDPVQPGEVEEEWVRRCQAASDGKGFDAWQKIYMRFLRVFPHAAKRARTLLVDEGIVGKDFIVIADDEDGDLIPLCLTKSQVSRFFPEFDARAVERTRLAGLPIDERLAELLPQVMGTAEPGPLIGEYEDLVRDIGEAAVPALLDIVTCRANGRPVTAIILLAEINHSTADVVAALETTMIDGDTNESTRAWAARALALLNHMDAVVLHAAELPIGTIAAPGLAAPYSSWRDTGNHRPLDYTPLEAALREHPELADAVAVELAPGRGDCQIDATETDAARAGLASEWEFIRHHAQRILKDFETR